MVNVRSSLVHRRGQGRKCSTMYIRPSVPIDAEMILSRVWTSGAASSTLKYLRPVVPCTRGSGWWTPWHAPGCKCRAVVDRIMWRARRALLFSAGILGHFGHASTAPPPQSCATPGKTARRPCCGGLTHWWPPRETPPTNAYISHWWSWFPAGCLGLC